MTAEDVAYTWATHVKYETAVAAANRDYIETIEAVDPQTVVIKAKLDANGRAVNPLIVQAYLSTYYVIQKAWTQKLEERSGGDPTKLLADPAEDVVYSGPYANSLPTILRLYWSATTITGAKTPACGASCRCPSTWRT